MFLKFVTLTLCLFNIIENCWPLLYVWYRHIFTLDITHFLSFLVQALLCDIWCTKLVSMHKFHSSLFNMSTLNKYTKKQHDNLKSIFYFQNPAMCLFSLYSVRLLYLFNHQNQHGRIVGWSYSVFHLAEWCATKTEQIHIMYAK